MYFRKALWLTPVAMVAHNAEEYPAIVDYANRHGWRMSRTQMLVAIVLVTLLPFPITAAASRSQKGGFRLILGLALPAALFVNALGHLGQTIFYRDYSPGTATGLGVNVPLAVYLYRRASHEGQLSDRQLRHAAALGTVMLFPVVFAAQAIGRLVDTRQSR